MKLKALKSLVALPIVAAVFVLRDYAKEVLTVLFVLVILFFCLGAIWVNLFPKWNPRGYFERRKHRKLMEFTNNRDRG